MHVIAVHAISQPDSFFAAAQPTPIPEGMSLWSVIPSSDHSRCVCIWEADSQQAVADLVERTVDEYSANEYFEVDSAMAQGLPA